MRRKMLTAPLAAVAALAMLAACSTDDSLDDPSAAESAADPAGDETADDETATDEEPADEGSSDDWFDQAVYDTQYEQRSATFEGDASAPHLQYIDGPMTDTSEFASEGAKKVCFSNASIGNPWRQTGWITMNEQLKVLQDSGVISEMETRDAQDDDNTQIADIDYFIAEGNCDAFVISPNSTAAMTPAVERA